MQTVKPFKSLQFKTVSNIILAFIAAVAIFIVCFVSGEAFNKNIINNADVILARKYKQIETFGKYVAQNSVNADDYDILKSWCEKNNCRLIIIDDSRTHVISATNAVSYDDTIYDDEFVLAKVQFADGTYDTSVIGRVDNISYGSIIIVSFVLAVFVFLLIILFNLKSLISRIVTLSNEVIDIRKGNLDRQIESNGNDELSVLALNVDKMRVSLIKHYESEKHALRSNTELLTSISHDIRTPLTALTGYAEIMADEQITDIAEMREYASICRDKAYQLKDLTDTLFRYFLVYGDVNITPKIKEYILSELVSGVIDTHIEYLKQRGYRIEYIKDIPEDCIINTDIMLQKRLYDNIFSNISKYALKDGIIIKVTVADGKLNFYSENRIDKTALGTESTGIGLKSCAKLAALLNSSITSKERTGFFYTEISFPL